MNVLLVTTANNLAEKLYALNPELEYAAIVVDDVASARNSLAQIGLSKCFVSSMDELANCIECLWYDYVLCVTDELQFSLPEKLKGYKIPQNKLMHFWALNEWYNFFSECALRYCKEHIAEAEMFATGTSRVEHGLDPAKFKLKVFNFGTPSQDLYYNFLLAKQVILYGGGDNKLRYALVGLAPYSFHYDFSRVQNWKVVMLRHFIAFRDLHNFPVPTNVYESFFRKEWLDKKLPLESINPNSPLEPKLDHRMTKEEIDSDILIITWEGKYYPKTRDENIKILDDYLTLCEENNICPVIFTIPVTEKHTKAFNKELLEESYALIEQALKKHPTARFFDGWKLEGFNYSDFHDHTHMNMYGAAKFSTYFNEFIEHLDNGG